MINNLEEALKFARNSGATISGWSEQAKVIRVNDNVVALPMPKLDFEKILERSLHGETTKQFD